MSQNRRTQKSGNGRESITKHPSHTFNLAYRGVRLLLAADLTPHCGKSLGLILSSDWSKNNRFYTSLNTTSDKSCSILNQPYISLCSDEFNRFSPVNQTEINFIYPIAKFPEVFNLSLVSLG